MKPARKRKPKVAEVQKENNATSCTAVKKSVKRPSVQRCNPTCNAFYSGQTDQVLVERAKLPFPWSAADPMCPQLPDKGTYSPEKTTKSPSLKLDETLHASAKIKLQLFPMDEGTRIGLEKDGYHPYLELTLRVRKKISSVLKHISGKWGSSSIALGEPMLFPYDLCLDKMGSQRRWTSSNTAINAGDVYAAVGSPAIFRLRYGWLCNNEPESFGISSTSIAFKACSQSEEVPKGCRTYKYNLYGIEKPIDRTRMEFQSNRVTEGINAVVAEKKPLDVPVGAVEENLRMDNFSGQSSMQWDDSLTNISIGGLFSEASLQGRFSICDPKSNGSNLSLQPTQVISDSFDAFIASQVNCPQDPRPISHDSHSSILDAEETCHAFSFQKLSPACKDVQALGGSTDSGAGILAAVSKSTRFPNFAEINSLAGVPQDHAHQEAKTDLSLCSQLYKDESSLGLRGIKWTDSLGPFDIGLASSGKIIGGDSISMSSFVS